MSKVIPIIPLESLVPKGDYCYTLVGLTGESPGAMRVKACPFWDKREEHVQRYGAQGSGYCHYLRQGDWMEGGTFLLWDRVKECGINYSDYEFDLMSGPVEADGESFMPLPVPGSGPAFEVPLT